MDFGRIIFMAQLIGGEIMRWLEENWRVVLLLGLAALVLVGILT